MLKVEDEVEKVSEQIQTFFICIYVCTYIHIIQVESLEWKLEKPIIIGTFSYNFAVYDV